MRLFSAFLIVVAALALGCSKKCDPDDISTWDATCPTGRGGGGAGGHGVSGGSPPVEYHHSTAPGLPDQMRVFGSFERDATVSGYNFDSTGSRLRFQVSVPSVTIDPAIPTGGGQLWLYEAASFFVAPPNVPGCEFRNGFGTAGQSNNVITLDAPANSACTSLFNQMAQTGFIVMFADVPVNSGGKVGQVGYQVTR